MSQEYDEFGRPIIVSGRRRCVVCAVTANGKSPAMEYLQGLDNLGLRRLWALFEQIAAEGRTHNLSQYKKEQGDIWAFKRDEHRIACYQDGRYVVLTHGFVKQQQKWRKKEFQKANRIREADLARRRGRSPNPGRDAEER